MKFDERPLRDGRYVTKPVSLVETARAMRLAPRMHTLDISAPKRMLSGIEKSNGTRDDEVGGQQETEEGEKKLQEAETKFQSVAENQEDDDASDKKAKIKLEENWQKEMDYIDKFGALEVPSDQNVVEAMNRQLGYVKDSSVLPRLQDSLKPEDEQSFSTGLLGSGEDAILPLAKTDWELIVPYDQWVGAGMMHMDGPPSDADEMMQATTELRERQHSVTMYFAYDTDLKMDKETDEAQAAELKAVEADIEMLDDTDKVGMSEEDMKKKDKRTERLVSTAQRKQKMNRNLRSLEVGGAGQFLSGPAPLKTEWEEEQRRAASAGTEGNANPDIKLTHQQYIRKHIFQYGNDGNELNGGCVVLSYNALHLQARARGGLPLTSKGNFLSRCEYKDTGNLDDPGARKRYDRANRFRMEVGRKWWALFNNMEGAVQREIIERSQDNYLDIQRLAEDLKKEIEKEGNGNANVTTDDIRSALTSGPMVTAVTELGPWGGLNPGKITPTMNVTRTKIDGSEEGEYLFNYEYKREDTVEYNDESEELSRAWTSTASGVENSLRLDNDQTWPLVKIGKTTRWLDWTKTGIGFKNNQAFKILQLFYGVTADVDAAKQKLEENSEGDGPQSNEDFVDKFTDDSNIYRTFSWRSAEGNKVLEPFIRKERDSDEEVTNEELDQMWTAVEHVFDDLIDACPFWVENFLSPEMVEDSDLAEEQQRKAEQLFSSEKELMVALNSERYVLDNPSMQQSRIADQTKRWERAVRNLYWNRSLVNYNDPNGTTYYLGNFKCVLYPVPLGQDLINERLDNDHDGVEGISWAHEQLIRSIISLNVMKNEVMRHPELVYNTDEHTDKNGKLVKGVRYVDGIYHLPSDGHKGSLLFSNWVREMVLMRPLGYKGQLVTCVNMVQLVSESLTQEGKSFEYDEVKPWYLNAHGQTGVIISQEYNTNPNDFPFHRYDVLMEFKIHDKAKMNLEKKYYDNDGRLVLRGVPATNLWPLSFKENVRYTDRGKFSLSEKNIQKMRSVAGNELLIKHIRDGTQFTLLSNNWCGPVEELQEKWGGPTYPSVTTSAPYYQRVHWSKSKYTIFVNTETENRTQLPPPYLKFETAFQREQGLLVTEKEEAERLIKEWWNKLVGDRQLLFFAKKAFVRIPQDQWEHGTLLTQEENQEKMEDYDIEKLKVDWILDKTQ